MAETGTCACPHNNYAMICRCKVNRAMRSQWEVRYTVCGMNVISVDAAVHIAEPSAVHWCMHTYRYMCPTARECFLPRCMECRRGLAMRFLSIRPSVKRMNYYDKTKETYVHIFIPYERSSPSFLTRRMAGIADDRFYLNLWAKLRPRQKHRFSIYIRSSRLSRNT